ncbi:hypothetical protein QG516_24590 [Pedobacter gandavensis]|uniref:hypothetical protein n=1 Tax=Pedobacter gandavensis TaxID=2679963 RepID=UPI002478689C|nr:hypothetical protein [Pedobacter gandavensis]WGQ09696.1 hypothetical protein QG516_24590 [Pedobacter gandavensis]
MIIKEVLAQLAEAQTGPVIKVLEKGDQFKLIVLGFKKQMVLKAHQTPLNAKLVVIEGKVNYIEADRLVVMNKFDELAIPKSVVHSVQALEDSVCLLIQSHDVVK